MSKLKVRAMSTVMPKADKIGGSWNVHFVPIADIASLIGSPRRRARNVGGVFGDCTGARVSAPD
jgi:hypothetical protein